MKQQQKFEYVTQFENISWEPLFQQVIIHKVTIIMLDLKMAGRKKSDTSL